jgi:hypothetical protein
MKKRYGRMAEKSKEFVAAGSEIYHENVPD